ncbi:hypothetical protein [Tepidimicrobium xylanilyticum]|uniref:hypothetical protein n=1 Tax=Tepidimicrobium xylanilyticum TaxID=1123352 RepID=UPI00264FFD52|nr:hypothetical protein [Tepidimicrobium xylanilyticum]GMG97519.1 hypothetical protein EN5CB1_23450 [Tepidimicrobium xylanilyticum]
MNPMLKKLVDQDFMTESQSKYLEDAIDRKESIIVSGHKGWGILPLMATLMAIAKTKYKTLQVKGFDDMKNEDIDYFLIPGISNIDFEKLIKEAMTVGNISFISIKNPDHPYSIFKLLREVFKENEDTSKVYQILECAKIDDEPKLVKITQVTLNEKGRLIKKDFEG